MHALTPQQILTLWSDYASAHPIDRELAAIAAASSPEQARTLMDQPLGNRERWAVGVRRATFGDDWEGLASCPSCGTPHELEPPHAALGDLPAASGPVTVRSGDHSVEVKAVTTRDQAVAAAARDAGEAARLLLERCVLSARSDAGSVQVTELPSAVRDAVEQAAAALDPAAETLLELTCVQCEGVWQTTFDAGEFLWSEIATCAQRLLRQVDVLARAYGWRESDVLALSPLRREAYLELLGGA